MRHGGRGVVDGIRRIDVPCVVDAPCRGVRRACRRTVPCPARRRFWSVSPPTGSPKKPASVPWPRTRAPSRRMSATLWAPQVFRLRSAGAPTPSVGGRIMPGGTGGGGRSLLEPPPRGAAPGSLPTGGLGPDSVSIFRRNDKSTVSEGAAPADIVPEGLVHCLVGLSTPLTFRTSWHTRARRPVAGVPGFAQVTLMVTVSFSVILIGVTQ